VPPLQVIGTVSKSIAIGSGSFIETTSVATQEFASVKVTV